MNAKRLMTDFPSKSWFLTLLRLALLAILVVTSSRAVLSAAQVRDEDEPLVQQGSPSPQPPSPYVSHIVRQGDDAALALPQGKGGGEVVVLPDGQLPPQSLETEQILSDRGISLLGLGEGSAVDAGYQWLVDNQNPSGSWGSATATELRDTMAVMEAIRWLGETDETAYQAAINWFRNVNPSNNDYLARKIAALANAGEDVSDLDDTLAAQRNASDGFGYQEGYGSEILTSVQALKALAASEYTDAGGNPDETTVGTLNYLLGAQNPDGGWGYLVGEPSNVYVTCLGLDAIWPYAPYTTTGAGYVVEDEINEGLAWLKDQQNPDDGWGAGASTVYQTALATYTLLEYEETPNDSSGAYNYLLNAQDANGSWDNDPYATALAIRALASRPGQLVIDSGSTPPAYYTEWQAGDIIGTVLTPPSDLYHVKIESVMVVLWNDFPGAGSQAVVRAKIYSVRDGEPYALLGASGAYTITQFLTWKSIDISDLDITIFSSDSFMVAIEYLSGTAGSTPSTLLDTHTNIPQNRNFYYYSGQWYEHYSLWGNPEARGYNMIRATIKTNVATPQAITEATAAKDGDNIVLSYPAVTRDTKGGRVGVKEYCVYASNNFLSEPIPAEQIGCVTATTPTLIGAASGSDSKAYLITAGDALGRRSAGSNKGFKLAYSVGAHPTQNMTYLALPFNYGTPGVTKASDLGFDVFGTTPPNLSVVGCFNPESDEYQEILYFNGTWIGSDWVLEKGQAVYVKAQASTTAVLVGSHDDDYAISIDAHPTQNMTYLSAPYHTTRSTASELGFEVFGSTPPNLSIVGRFNPEIDEYQEILWFNGSWIGSDWTLQPGQGVYVKAQSDTTWTPSHH